MASEKCRNQSRLVEKSAVSVTRTPRLCVLEECKSNNSLNAAVSEHVFCFSISKDKRERDFWEQNIPE